jgi:uncharacterized protein YkuJ
MFRALLASTALLLTAYSAHADGFKFVALGDNPYGIPAEVNPSFEVLIKTINDRAPAFAVHIGDTKSGSTLCDNAMLDQQLKYMNTFASALIYTPGDNEWTDCHREKAGKFDPLERLDYLRKAYFADPAKSLGAVPMAVETQSALMADTFAKFAENRRFVKDGVMFMTAHVVGSNNNFEVRDPKAVAEYFERDAANVAWLENTFDVAKAQDAKAVVVAYQADMFEFDFNEFQDETFLRHSGYQNFGSALVKKANEFGRPVLIVHGDSHIYRVYRPFSKTAPNITALEVFGETDMNAVEVTVEPNDPAVFSFKPIINPSPVKKPS